MGAVNLRQSTPEERRGYMRRVISVVVGLLVLGLVGPWASADEVIVAGSWLGQAVIGGGAAVTVNLDVVQTGTTLSGKVEVRGRVVGPGLARDYDTKLEGKVEGRAVTIVYWTPESRKVVGTLTLAGDGKMLSGPGHVEGTLFQGQFTFRKP